MANQHDKAKLKRNTTMASCVLCMQTIDMDINDHNDANAFVLFECDGELSTAHRGCHSTMVNNGRKQIKNSVKW